MVISITSSRPNDEQLSQTEAFLKTFLPKMRKFPGIVAIYLYSRADGGDDSTIVIWESEAALKLYRQSELIKEAMAFEKKLDIPTIRDAYPLTYSL